MTHKHNLLLSLITVMSILASTEAKGARTSESEREGGVPRLVVNILIDQLRTDYLEAFAPLYGVDGLQRLLNEGRVYTQAEYPLAHPDRASAAATVATGTSAADHGIVAWRWMNRETLRPMVSVQDFNVRGRYTVERFSPRWLNVSTIGDELKVATSGKAQVVAIAPDADAAIFSAGHAADQVIWLDDNTGNWASSSYYGDFPKWAEHRNVYQNIEVRLKTKVWQPLNEQVGSFSYFLTGKHHKSFSHDFRGNDRFRSFKTSALVNDEVTAAAIAALHGTSIGQDLTTDYLSVTLYAGTHRHRPASECALELQDTYARLDRAIAQIVAMTEQKVGRGNALFAVTSTGYTDEETPDLSRYRIPTGTFDMRRATGLLGMYLVAVYGQGDYIEATYGNQIYFNHRLLEERQINVSELQARAQDFLLQLAGVKDVYTAHRLLQGAWTPGISRIRGGFHQQRSGDITLQIMPGWRIVDTDHQQTKTAGESFMAFPIILYGAGIERSVITTPVTVDCIAPTLSKAMRIRAPNACGKAPLI
ncbi:alkaline phosphatase family protein [Alloprevotella sp. OH1205_COT-284]|uniref:alkaline phosphatase family protein n=1 Tax=Alloprevotella sp. OH1205_COT-284 TaxID=2491043 RepID=UPI0018F2BA7B|nr:alkaline phosphatase family protein [Alloprevotella sp. OH1205_COT-284]